MLKFCDVEIRQPLVGDRLWSILAQSLFKLLWLSCHGVRYSNLFSVCKESEALVLSLLGAPTARSYHHMTMLSQVLALLSDTGRRGQTLLSVPKHSQTSQDAAETPPRRPRGLQDRPKTPKMTPKAPPRGLMLEPRELQKTNKNQWFLIVFRESSLCLSSSVRC